VRSAIGAGFPGTYEHLFYVADVTARGRPMNKELQSGGHFAEWARTQLLPRILPRAMSTRLGKHFLFGAVSQIVIEYRRSAWSEGRAGTVHAGDRLPWIAPARVGDANNFTPLTSLDWQVHVYGAPPSALASACEAHRILLHTFSIRRAGQSRVAAPSIWHDPTGIWAECSRADTRRTPCCAILAHTACADDDREHWARGFGTFIALHLRQ
jgi:hypothetical protein